MENEALGGFQSHGGTQGGGSVRVNPTKIDDFGVTLFQETCI